MNKIIPEKLKPLLVVVAGPTASGKTNIAIQLARYFQTDILSFDSRQCFREMNIGVAKPTEAELAQAKHHFIHSHSIREPVDAALFESYGLNALQTIFSNHQIAIAVGGTGLYMKALCEGIDPMPLIPEEIRSSIRNLFQNQGLEAIQHCLKQEDPEFATSGEMHNPQRVMRALEVIRSTGKSIRHFQQKTPVERPFRILYLGMQLPKEVLHERINARVDLMLKEGLLAEVQQLLPFKNLNALQTVGYKEIFDHLEGKISLQEAAEWIKIHTRQYAKRQMTWFSKVAGIHWVAPDNPEIMIDLIEKLG
jgi:tRNA dimethylallyltransferase